MKSKALVILSGGQDSTTCLLWAKELYDEVHAISFDYGQRHIIEIESAKKVAEIIGVDSHAIVDVRGLLKSTSPLIDKAAVLEEYDNADSMEKTIGNRIELTFVPLRNLLFAVVAANHAVAMGCYSLVTGVCQLDTANYPDCTSAFLRRTVDTMREALGMNRTDYTGPTLQLLAPLLNYTKAETVRISLTFPNAVQALSYSHTCYAGVSPPCGRCHACILRAQGFAEAGYRDPLVERTK